MKKKDLKEILITNLLKGDETQRTFLESLTVRELQSMTDSEDDDDAHVDIDEMDFEEVEY